MGQRDTWCKHRTSFSKELKVCKVGVDFHKFGPKYAPCLGESPGGCDKFCGWTAEEIAAREAEFAARLKRIGVIREAIVASVKTTGIRAGYMPCPACKTGTVGYSQASNGHVHAKCSTDGCAAWME